MSTNAARYRDLKSRTHHIEDVKMTLEPTSPQENDGLYGLKSKWPRAFDLAGSDLPCRFEGEVADLVVLGQLPKEINGTFYRVMCDPFVPPHPGNVPVDGDGNISAIRFHDGRVDMKMRYVKTERYLLERKANKALFGLYRNPYTHHPCVRAAVDTTANTNVVYWAGKLLAVKEGALPYEVGPDSLDTIRYDPFGQVRSKTFTAHPKVDPFTEELVVFGYEAKGLATNDIATYTLDKHGKVVSELWLKSPWVAFIHDCAITPNWLILALWPFETDIERMKAGKQHWAWNYDRPATWIVVPRRNTTPLPPGWKVGEWREYYWENCMAMHTAGAWEDADGKLYVESSRICENAFPFFPPVNGRMPTPGAKADFCRWQFDLSKPSGSKIADPEVIIDAACEFPRIDERFNTKKYEFVVVPVFQPQNSDLKKNVYQGLNALCMHNHRTKKSEYFYVGDNAGVQEPVFVPRSKDAPEGDGWVIAMVERKAAARCDVVILDTRSFEAPVAIVQLPFHVKAQIHGNWVDAADLGQVKSLVEEVAGDLQVSGLGALERL